MNEQEKSLKIETELAIKDIIIQVLYSWKPILICALTFAIVLASLGAFRVYKEISDPKQVNKAMDKYNLDQQSYNTDLQNKYAALDILNKNSMDFKNYIDNSVYFNLDAYKRPAAEIVLSVDTGYEIDPNLTYQTTDTTPAIISSYSRVVRNQELYSELSKIIGSELDSAYIEELVFVSSIGERLILIYAYYDDIETAEKMVDNIYEYFSDEVYPSLNAINPHKLEFVSRNAGYGVDTNLINIRNERQTSMNTLNDAIDLAVKSLTAKLAQAPTEPSFSNSNIFKKAVKYGILGLALGGILSLIIVVFYSYNKNRIDNLSDLQRKFNLYIIGTINNKRYYEFNHPFKKLIYKISPAYIPIKAESDNFQMIGANLSTVASEGNDYNNILFLSESLPDKVNEIVENIKIDGATTVSGGNLSKDVSTIRKIRDAEAIVIIEQLGKVRNQELTNEILVIEKLNKPILGIIMSY